MSSIDQNPLWIIPYAALLLLMVFAMMEFTISLLVKRPRRHKEPMTEDELRRRLLALNERGLPYRLVDQKDSELELQWDVVDSSWRRRFAKVKLDVTYRAHLLLNEAHHELRIYEVLRTSNFFVGFDGWLPRLNFSFSMQAGFVNALWSGRAYGILPGFPPRIGDVYDFELNTLEARREIGRLAEEAGLVFRPVLWRFQTTRSGARLLEALTPAPLRQWSAR